MATIKVKFRPSAVNGKAGAVCYQLCHRQENKQITTSMRIFPHWWNPQKRELITTPDNAATVSAYRRQIEQDVHKLREIVRQLDAASQPYTLTDVVRLFQSDLASNGILEYLQKEILRLQDNNQYGTSRNYRRTLSSFSTFLKGTDVPLPAVDATLIGRYEKWLAQRNVRRNSSSFYMRILRAAYNKAVRENWPNSPTRSPRSTPASPLPPNGQSAKRPSSSCKGSTCPATRPCSLQETSSYSVTVRAAWHSSTWLI